MTPSRRNFIAGATASAAVALTDVRPLPARAAAEKAVVFVNGAVYTVNSKQPWAKAVTVEAGRITFVGDAAAAKAHAPVGARVIDLRGKFLLPGFVEGHIHPVLGGYISQGAQLQFDTREQILAALEA
jgi:predicted amidohydrolase YtcJ